MPHQWISHVDANCSTRSMRRNANRDMDCNRRVWENNYCIKNNYSNTSSCTYIYKSTG